MRVSGTECTIDAVVDSEADDGLTAQASRQGVEEVATLVATLPGNEVSELGDLPDDDACGETHSTNELSSENETDSDTVSVTTCNGRDVGEKRRREHPKGSKNKNLMTYFAGDGAAERRETEIFTLEESLQLANA